MKDKQARENIDRLAKLLDAHVYSTGEISLGSSNVSDLRGQVIDLRRRVAAMEKELAPKCPVCESIVTQEEFQRIVHEVAKKVHKK